jgi:magnesium chelatase subunit D
VELVLAHRRALTEAEPDDAVPPEPPQDQGTGADELTSEEARLPEELLLEAAQASLPADLLAQLAAGRALRSARAAGGSGDGRNGNRRGRPLLSRPGRPDGRARIDLVATLRAAAPWQSVRRSRSAAGRLIEIRADDIRLKRYLETSDRLLIFAVDASGSAALARLAEAKGAIELLLAEAYVRRDHVALIAFRGTEAEVLLPPTRSLVQTKRRLTGLPGGGGTPLAAGLQAALELGLLTRARGMTPSILLLTDGRANVALDGSGDRARAGRDADRLARMIRGSDLPALVIDTGARPKTTLADLARLLGAPYVPLPRADAHHLSAVLGAALAD